MSMRTKLRVYTTVSSTTAEEADVAKVDVGAYAEVCDAWVEGRQKSVLLADGAADVDLIGSAEFERVGFVMVRVDHRIELSVNGGEYFVVDVPTGFEHGYFLLTGRVTRLQANNDSGYSTRVRLIAVGETPT